MQVNEMIVYMMVQQAPPFFFVLGLIVGSNAPVVISEVQSAWVGMAGNGMGLTSPTAEMASSSIGEGIGS